MATQTKRRAHSETTFKQISDLEVQMTRVFDAPRTLLWEATTDPKHVTNWWGPREQKLISCEVDFRVGGKWRMVSRGPDGVEHGFHGVYKEIVPQKRVVQTFNYEGIPAGHELTTTVVYEDIGGKTRLTSTSRYLSTGDLEGMVKSGMERGARESWERLAELIDGLAG